MSAARRRRGTGRCTGRIRHSLNGVKAQENRLKGESHDPDDQTACGWRRNNRGSGGILGALFGLNTRMDGRVLNVSRVTPRRNDIRVTGYATSGRYAYNRYGYGIGAYGTLGANYTPDLRYRCDVDYRGYVRDVDIMRR